MGTHNLPWHSFQDTLLSDTRNLSHLSPLCMNLPVDICERIHKKLIKRYCLSVESYNYFWERECTDHKLRQKTNTGTILGKLEYVLTVVTAAIHIFLQCSDFQTLSTSNTQKVNHILLDGERLKNLASQLFQIKRFIWKHSWRVILKSSSRQKQNHSPFFTPLLCKVQENSLSEESCTWPKKAGSPCGGARTEGRRGIEAVWHRHRAAQVLHNHDNKVRLIQDWIKLFILFLLKKEMYWLQPSSQIYHSWHQAHS